MSARPWRLSMAPMMDRTDRWFRAMFRDISRHALLYTPMISARAIVNGDAETELDHDLVEHPLAIQLGGSDPHVLASASRIASDRGFCEVNLNCGCPSPAATQATWGAALMDHPARVAEAVAAMVAATKVPITVKHRLGIVGRDDEGRLLAFVDAITAAGAARVIVHARAAILGGASTAKNRRIPPLRPEMVVALVRARPGLVVVDNGGIVDLAGAAPRWAAVGPNGGVMIGRAAYDDPYRWIDVDRVAFADDTPRPSRFEIAERVLARASGHPRPHLVTRHALGLWHGVPQARRARELVATIAHGLSPRDAVPALAALQ